MGTSSRTARTSWRRRAAGLFIVGVLLVSAGCTGRSADVDRAENSTLISYAGAASLLGGLDPFETEEPTGPGRALFDGRGVLHVHVPRGDPHESRTVGLAIDQYRTGAGADPQQVQIGSKPTPRSPVRSPAPTTRSPEPMRRRSMGPTARPCDWPREIPRSGRCWQVVMPRDCGGWAAAPWPCGARWRWAASCATRRLSRCCCAAYSITISTRRCAGQLKNAERQIPADNTPFATSGRGSVSRRSGPGRGSRARQMW